MPHVSSLIYKSCRACLLIPVTSSLPSLNWSKPVLDRSTSDSTGAKMISVLSCNSQQERAQTCFIISPLMVSRSAGAHHKIYTVFATFSILRSTSLGLVLSSMVVGEVIETAGASVILSAVQGTALASNLCSSSPRSHTGRAPALSTECLRLDAMVGS